MWDIISKAIPAAASIWGGIEGQNAHNSAADELRKKFEEYAGEYNPYIERGHQAGNQYLDQSQWMIQNPNALQDMIAQGYQASPYQNLLLDMTRKQMNANSANTGMIRSPVAQQALNDRMNEMTGQFMNDYISRGMNTYGLGYGGLNTLNQMGMQGQNARSNLLSQAVNGYVNNTLAGKENFINGIIEAMGGMGSYFGSKGGTGQQGGGFF